MEDQDKSNLPADPDASTPATGSESNVTPGQTTGPSAEPIGVYPAPATPSLPPTPTPSYTAGAMAPTETNAWAIVSLISSILSWIGLFGLGGIVGVITGVIARNQIRESHGRQGGDGIAVAGIILGGVNIVLSCIALLCFFALFAGFFTIPFMNGDFR
jgi:hypothetical protein